MNIDYGERWNRDIVNSDSRDDTKTEEHLITLEQMLSSLRDELLELQLQGNDVLERGAKIPEIEAAIRTLESQRDELLRK